MDDIKYETPDWWRPICDTILYLTFEYMLENDKTFSGAELDRLKCHLIKNHLYNRTPKDFETFWDDEFPMDPEPVDAYVARFRGFDVGFIRQKMNEMDPSFRDCPFQKLYFTSYKIPGAVCPDCKYNERKYQIVMDNVLETARCEACGVTDFIYAFRQKGLSESVRAGAENELVRIFKEAEASRVDESEPLEQTIIDAMEALRKETDLILCTESQIHTKEEKEKMPPPAVQNILPTKERRYP